MLKQEGKISPETMTVRKVPESLANLDVNPLSVNSVNKAASKIRQETLGGDFGVNTSGAQGQEAAQEKTPKLVNKQKLKPAEVSSHKDVVTAQVEEDLEPVAEDFEEETEDHSQTIRRSLRLDEIDADEIEIEIDGEVYQLSKDDLKSGIGLYENNNKKAKELANKEKALEAERATVVAKAGQELDQFHTAIESRMERNRQIEELLIKAFNNNYDSYKFPDGRVITIAQLEKEQKVNELDVKRLQRERTKKEEEVKVLEADYRNRQWDILRNEDPAIFDRMDDLSSYLKRQGFNDAQSEYLARNSDARVIKMIDKARKFDSSVAAKPQKKMVSKKTEVINQSTRRTESRIENPVASARSQWQKVLSAGQGHPKFKDALAAVRLAERRVEKNLIR